MRMARLLGLLACCALMGLSTTAQVKGDDTLHQGDANSQTTAQSGNQPAAEADYTIGVDDVLDISVWKEPDVSRVVPVRPDGRFHCRSSAMSQPQGSRLQRSRLRSPDV